SSRNGPITVILRGCESIDFGKFRMSQIKDLQARKLQKSHRFTFSEAAERSEGPRRMRPGPSSFEAPPAQAAGVAPQGDGHDSLRAAPGRCATSCRGQHRETTRRRAGRRPPDSTIKVR